MIPTVAVRARASIAAAAVLSLAACGREPPVSVQNAAEATIDNLEAQANALEAKAAEQVNEAGAGELANAAAAFDAGSQPANDTAVNIL